MKESKKLEMNTMNDTNPQPVGAFAERLKTFLDEFLTGVKISDKDWTRGKEESVIYRAMTLFLAANGLDDAEYTFYDMNCIFNKETIKVSCNYQLSVYRNHKLYVKQISCAELMVSFWVKKYREADCPAGILSTETQYAESEIMDLRRKDERTMVEPQNLNESKSVIKKAESIAFRIMSDYEFYKDIPVSEAITTAMVDYVDSLKIFIEESKNRIGITKGEKQRAPKLDESRKNQSSRSCHT